MGRYAGFARKIVEFNKSIPDYTEQFVKAIRLMAKEVEGFDEKQYPDVTPENVLRLSKIGKDYYDYINAFLLSNRKFIGNYGIASEKEIEDDIEFISKEVKDKSVHCDFYETSIIFTREIQMHDVYRDASFNFGNFKIYMLPTRVRVCCHSNNTKKNEHYHPYVQGERLCLGEYLEPYKVLMKNFRYYAAYQLVIRCMTEYSGDGLNGTQAGPHNPIAEWTGQNCTVCDEIVQIENIQVCGKTGRVICPKCIDTGECTDETDGDNYHPDVLKICTKCKKKASTVLHGKCLGCRRAERI
jgi:hypothetical protein